MNYLSVTHTVVEIVANSRANESSSNETETEHKTLGGTSPM